jgi:hypothetical protein
MNAIRLAKSQNLSENLHFYKQNVVTDAFPGTNYNLILCFSALQQLNDAELNVVFAKVKAALELKGTFFGSVSLIPQNAVLHTEEQVRNYLSRYFNITETYLSPWPKGRIECYFRCSAGQKFRPFQKQPMLRQVRISRVRNLTVRPKHLSDQNFDHDYYFELPLQGAGCPIKWTTRYFTPCPITSFPACEPNSTNCE